MTVVLKICITKNIFVLLQPLCQEAQISSFQVNGHKNTFKITASDKEKKTYLTLLTLISNFAINLFYILLLLASASLVQPKYWAKTFTLLSCPISLAFGFRQYRQKELRLVNFEIFSSTTQGN